MDFFALGFFALNFFALDQHVPGCVEAQLHAVTNDSDDNQFNGIANNDTLVRFATENKHCVSFPAGVNLSPIHFHLVVDNQAINYDHKHNRSHYCRLKNPLNRVESYIRMAEFAIAVCRFVFQTGWLHQSSLPARRIVCGAVAVRHMAVSTTGESGLPLFASKGIGS